ncbi:UDP-N-acetylmuramoyl-tripeptide--D-alanyl-D-alanine ligase [Aeribacillus pallidus]|uniref:UDP-N-acetylmuramoyl-tripeptide--D-alanyl-D- alanine ligase n=1 Tax=Aeribacillus pallidus TaxID=33936 RepID=UPI003D25AE30
MIRRTIGQIALMIPVQNDVSVYSMIEIHGVSIDSRKIEKGNLFIPFQGEKVDGHQFVEDALRKGAAASLWKKDVPNPPKDVPILMVDDPLHALQELARAYRNELQTKVVGITGSNGKTTTKDMTASLLSRKYRVQKTEGNFNNHIGLPLTILSLREDTEVAVIEMGMSAKGEISFLTKLARPEVAIITNIGESHLQDLGSREAIADAKLEIVEGLPKDGLLLYFGDEPLLRERVQNMKQVRTKTFGKMSTNDVYPTFTEQKGLGTVFSINRQPNEQFFLPVLGAHNLMNALAAMMVAEEWNISFTEMKKGLENLQLTKMRMELLEGKNGAKWINDAYNASPTSMKAAIQLLESLQGFERKIVVLGDMLELGPQEKEFHFQVGKSIDPNRIDYVFTYGELAAFISNGAKEQFPSDRVLSFNDKTELINHLKHVVKANDVILVKASRGMRLEEVVQTFV